MNFYPRHMILQLFAEAAAAPAGDPPAQPSAAPPADAAASETPQDDGVARLAELESQLAAANKKASDAEKARKKLETDQMTAEQRIAAQQGELSRQLNRIAAEKTLVGAGLTEAEYGSLLDLVTTEDKDHTLAVAQGIGDLLGKRIEAAVKAEREKLLEGTPYPPSGGGKDDIPSAFGDKFRQALGLR